MHAALSGPRPHEDDEDAEEPGGGWHEDWREDWGSEYVGVRIALDSHFHEEGAQGDDGPNLEFAAWYDGINVSGWAPAWSMH